MTRDIVVRNLYIRMTVDGKRKYVQVGTVGKSGRIRLNKGMPMPGWFEV